LRVGAFLQNLLYKQDELLVAFDSRVSDQVVYVVEEKDESLFRPSDFSQEDSEEEILDGSVTFK